MDKKLSCVMFVILFKIRPAFSDKCDTLCDFFRIKASGLRKDTVTGNTYNLFLLLLGKYAAGSTSTSLHLPLRSAGKSSSGPFLFFGCAFVCRLTQIYFIQETYCNTPCLL